ncbi:hypothetical protein D3C77_481320 [compost metagenome]
MHRRVEVFIVAAGADDDLFRRVVGLQHLFRDLLAGKLQPALVDVLEKRELCHVGVSSHMGAMEADQHTVQCHAALNGGQVLLQEVWEFRPAVDGGEFQTNVRFRLKQLIDVVLQVQQLARFAVTLVGVSAAGCRAAQAQHDLLAFDFADRYYVDATEKVGFLSDLVIQFLGMGRLNRESAGGVGHVVGIGQVYLELQILLCSAWAKGAH